jgi:hypothetical protein
VLAPPYPFLLWFPTQTNPPYRVGRPRRRLRELAACRCRSPMLPHTPPSRLVSRTCTSPSSLPLSTLFYCASVDGARIGGGAMSGFRRSKALRRVRDRMLQGRGGSAASGWKLCYQRRRHVLPTAAACATNGGGMCYQRRRALLPTAAALLQTAATSATYGYGLCYIRQRVVLQMADQRRRLCYIRRRALLPTAAGSATKGGGAASCEP